MAPLRCVADVEVVVHAELSEVSTNTLRHGNSHASEHPSALHF